MKHETHRLNHCLKQFAQDNTKVRRRPWMITTLAVLALVSAFLAFPGSRMALAQQGSGQKVTGSGTFVNDLLYGAIFSQYSIPGTICTFDFNAQTVDSAGNIKGQLQFGDKTSGIKIRAALTFTNNIYDTPLYGPATYSEGGVSKPGDWSVRLIPMDWNPDYFALQINSSDPSVGGRVWSGQLTNGNIKFH